MPEKGSRGMIDEDDEDPFLLYLYEHKFQDFVSYITTHTEKINCDNGEKTILQFACYYGFPEIVKVLLDLGADPNLTTVHYSKRPILIASYRGFADIIEIFLNSGKNVDYQSIESNVLLEVVVGSNRNHNASDVTVSLCDHGRSFQLLLSLDSQYDINLADPNGYTCLHYAAIVDNREYIFSLLDHGAYLGRKNNYGHSPLSELSSETLKLYLNKCVSSNGSSPNDLDYEIICSYHFLCPPKMCKPNNNDDNQNPSTYLPIETEDVNVENIPETTPLLYITQISELRPLLLHPVLTNFLDLKWNKIKFYFMLNLAFFASFLLTLTTYILLTSHMKFDYQGDEFKTDSKIAYYFRFVILGFLIVLGSRELFQFISFPIIYIKSIENWLEICLITLISVLLCEKQLIIEYDRVSVSAIVILMSWGEMILLLGRHPMFAIQLAMFKCVTKNFAHFLSWCSFLGIAFILSFNVLFYKKENFDSIFATAFRTMIMAGVGELNATSLPYGNNEIIGYLLLVLFVFLITLVLLNLLSGVAVSDTQEIKTDANIVVLTSRINFIYLVETMANSETHHDNSKKRFSFFNSSTLIKPFLKGLNLFPEVLKNPKIKILPNRGNRIDFGQSVKKSSIKYFENFQDNYSDKDTITKTKEIIELNSEKPKKTIEEILKDFVEKLKSLEGAVKEIKESMKSRGINTIK